MRINKAQGRRGRKKKKKRSRRRHGGRTLPQLHPACKVSKHDCIDEKGGEAKWKPEDDSVVCKQAAGLCVEGMNKESSLSSGRKKAA